MIRNPRRAGGECLVYRHRGRFRLQWGGLVLANTRDLTYPVLALSPPLPPSSQLPLHTLDGGSSTSAPRLGTIVHTPDHDCVPRGLWVSPHLDGPSSGLPHPLRFLSSSSSKKSTTSPSILVLFVEKCTTSPPRFLSSSPKKCTTPLDSCHLRRKVYYLIPTASCLRRRKSALPGATT